MFWEILKSSKGLPVDDPIAELWGQKMSCGWAVTELTGELPLAFLSDGGALKNYRIYGTAGGSGTATGGSEPAGYKIPLTVTSGQQSADYDLFIGDTKLSEEEYADYQEQKIQKRTVNCYNYELNNTDNGYTWGYYLSSSGGKARGTVWRITEYIPVSEGVYTLINARDASTVSAYVGLYDSTKTLVSTIAISRVGANTEITVPSVVAFVQLSVQNSVARLQTMLVKGTDVPAEHVPYFVLIDPPLPLPVISTYKGENTLSSTETVGSVTIRGRIKEST